MGATHPGSAPLALRTADVPSPARFEELRHYVRHAAIPLELASDDISRVEVQSAVHRLGALTFVGSDSANIRVHRTARLARDDTPSTVSVTLVRNGVHRVGQYDRTSVVAAGQFVVYASHAPYELRFDGRAATSTVQLPVAELGLPGSLLGSVLGRALPGSGAVGAVLRSALVALDDVAAHPGESTTAERLALGRSLTELVRALLATASGDARSTRDALAESVGTRVLAHIRAHLRDRDLTAAGVAAAHGISERYLYVILRRLEISLGDWVREQRLELAAAELSDPTRALLSVAAVALDVGFADAEYFSRLFSRRYGIPPSEWRRAALRDRPDVVRSSTGRSASSRS